MMPIGMEMGTGEALNREGGKERKCQVYTCRNGWGHTKKINVSTETNVDMFVGRGNIRAVPIHIANRKQKKSLLSGMFCRILFIPNHFNRNRNRNRFVPVIFEFVTICDHFDHL